MPGSSSWTPRRTETARIADEHIAILPGGDAALLLAMVGVLLRDERIDLQAVRGLANGFDDVAEVVRSLDPNRLAEEAGVPIDTIDRLAREFADARSSTAYARLGVCNNRHGTLASWSVDLLNLCAGRLGAIGGSMFARPALDIRRILRMPGMDGHARWRTRIRGLPETLGDLPAACMAEEMETPGDGQIRALVTYAGNPVLSVPNGRRLAKALESLDFMVSIDLYINETTRHADVILPPASPLNEEHLDLIFPTVMVRNVARVSPGVTENRGDEKHDWEILRDLAEGLGGGMLGSPWLDRLLRGLRRLGLDLRPNDILNALLRTGPHGDHFLPFSKGLSLAKLRRAPHGIDLGGLEPGLRDLVTHRDRKMKLDAAPLMGALRGFANQAHSRRDGELLLIGRRELRSGNSWLHNLPSLVKGRERCTLYVHPADAEAARISDGERAWMESRVHAGPVPVEVRDDVRPGVVSLPHGWGHADSARWQRVAGERPGVSMNDWTDDADLESVVGQSILSGVPVRLRSLDTSIGLPTKAIPTEIPR